MAIKLLSQGNVKDMTRRGLLAIAPGLLLVNCSTDSTSKTPEKPPEMVTGLHALYQMYTFARPWAQDLKVIRLTSLPVTEVKAAAGKAAAWQVLFASETLGKARIYTFSLYDESVTVRQGIFADTSGPLSQDVYSFPLGDAATDSDKAWDISTEHSQKYAAEHPGMPVFYILEGDRQKKEPMWRVIWGTSTSSSNYSILVDAHAGSYIRTMF
jgi:hypothetical protein